MNQRFYQFQLARALDFFRKNARVQVPKLEKSLQSDCGVVRISDGKTKCFGLIFASIQTFEERNMRKMSCFLAVTCMAVLTASANAQVTPTGLVVGEQGPFVAGEDDSTLANDSDWFIFTLTSDFDVDIDINRTEAAPDLFATLFEGDVTGVDFGGLLADDFTGPNDFGPLTFIETQDDTEDDAFGGPFGDPRFQLNLGPGTYSVLVTALSPLEGGPFTITSNVSAVPEPSAFAVLGLGGLLFARRRR